MQYEIIMASMLPEELSLSLLDQIPCRALQIRQLLALLSVRLPISLVNTRWPSQPTFPSPSSILLHGVEATGKSLTIKTVLNAIDAPSAIVRSQECITTRHLLERTVTVVKEALVAHGLSEEANGLDGRCESISAFVVELQRILEGREKFILVFDGIDRQREAAPTLLPAIARLGEIVWTTPLAPLSVSCQQKLATQPHHHPHNHSLTPAPPPPPWHSTHSLPTVHAYWNAFHTLRHPAVALL